MGGVETQGGQDKLCGSFDKHMLSFNCGFVIFNLWSKPSILLVVYLHLSRGYKVLTPTVFSLCIGQGGTVHVL